MFENQQDSLDSAKNFDQKDPLAHLRNEFHFPSHTKDPLYFAGHSLGLMPKKAKEYVTQDLEAWAKYGVEGHFEGEHPWLPYHENLTPALARLVGAQENEVVAMNTLTVNLHLLMVSFYRPTKTRFKILIENNTFPSDKYAVDSQARFHGQHLGFDASSAIVELKPRPGEMTVSEADLLEQIHQLGDSLSLVLLGNCNYLSGQCFPFEKIVQAAHAQGAVAGFNLAHGAGNLKLDLHRWNVDFAVWCSYKYLNSGAGATAGSFVHEKHLRESLPRFEGWWGHNKQKRFLMGPQFEAIPTVEAWQLSNPPILPLACLRASLELFDKAGMTALRKKGDHLTSYLEFLLLKKLEGKGRLVTPKNVEGSSAAQRGSMICIKIQGAGAQILKQLRQESVYLDFREPDIFRVTPAPLYNSYEDVWRLSEKLKTVFT